MPGVSRGHKEARALLGGRPMRQQFAAAILLAGTSACGVVEFGTISSSTDTGPDPVDTGPDTGPDLGSVEDTGEPPEDAGCLPVTLPPTLPAQWPFGTDQLAFETVFLDWAQEQNCTLCHNLDENSGGNSTPPLIVRDTELASYERSRDEIWTTVLASELKASSDAPLEGPLWRHVDTHVNYEQIFPYNSGHIRFLEDFIHQAWACQVPDFIAAQDAGPSCGVAPPPDAGPPVDVGPADAGVSVDGGPNEGGVVDPPTPSADPCYCEEQPDAGVFNEALCVPTPI